MKTFDATIFDLAPVAMWIEDFSGVKQQFDQWRAEGVEDIRAFLKQDMSRVAECSKQIRILQVNSKTLELFEARDLAHLVDNISVVFRDDMLESHINELAALWDGKTDFSSNAVNYSLSGRRMVWSNSTSARRMSRTLSLSTELRRASSIGVSSSAVSVSSAPSSMSVSAFMSGSGVISGAGAASGAGSASTSGSGSVSKWGVSGPGASGVAPKSPCSVASSGTSYPSSSARSLSLCAGC